mmetsp:Transcript_19713/g.29254  ORF Transcript_19713/g.29254 Transcript_19713/m.29254 type:complete len:445 (+) Transcript_19713:154-1488(+)|eukprot:CAMPEP_0194216554 /NCGR_PEP_ID=MMETSP0156-20130528/19234_1 /TAXON_ID=33649 /ORGANISM="Thalassionema nitzschioides, Strain L26-B" /LENGTH=444 /DNA_ID=CAMNT_0038945353 /DNA_START=77 /DNA_END=1411 /DNA_ORIENTATION=-
MFGALASLLLITEFLFQPFLTSGILYATQIAFLPSFLLTTASMQGVKSSTHSLSTKDTFTTDTSLKSNNESLSQIGGFTSYAPPEWFDLDRNAQIKLAKILSWESLSKWDFDIFEVSKLSEGQPLLFLGWALLSSPYSHYFMDHYLMGSYSQKIKEMEGYNFIDEFNIPQKSMVDFLRTVERKYKPDNPYHNNIHAADVLQTVHFFLKDNSSQVQLSSLYVFSSLVGATVHDIGHPGFTNDFMKNSHSDLAVRYENQSILESFHVNLTFHEILGEEGNLETNILRAMKPEEALQFKNIVTEIVLTTDMQRHKEHLTNMTEFLTPVKSYNDISLPLAKFILHVADISNCAKPYRSSIGWSYRVMEEFFLQGDREKELDLALSPLGDRDTTSIAVSQSNFIQYVVRPSFELLGGYIPTVGTHILPIIDENAKYWQFEIAKEQKDEC